MIEMFGVWFSGQSIENCLYILRCGNKSRCVTLGTLELLIHYCLCYLHSKFGADRSTASGDNDSFFAEGQVTKSENTTSANFV